MSEAIPPQCPECGSMDLKLSRVSPSDHSRGDKWVTHAVCKHCNEYTEWFD